MTVRELLEKLGGLVVSHVDDQPIAPVVTAVESAARDAASLVEARLSALEAAVGRLLPHVLDEVFVTGANAIMGAQPADPTPPAASAPSSTPSPADPSTAAAPSSSPETGSGA